MKKTTSRAVTLTAAALLFFACRKEKSTAAGCSITVDNISGSYKLTVLQYKADANATPVDFFATMDACEKDDITTLKNDGTYKQVDAGVVCNPSDDAQGTWQLHGNTLVSDGTANGTIARFDCKTLVFYVENTIKTGDRLTYTMVKQ